MGRYRGSVFGVLWSFLTPVLMLAVFTFVFGEIFGARWGNAEQAGRLDFAVALFAGLLVFYFFSECIGKAPGLITANANYVKKVVFPLEILAYVTVVAALFHLAAGYIVLLALMLVSNWDFSWAMLLAPVMFLPLLLMVLGFTWALSALGVYLRDINQIIAPALTAAMFLSPIFYPLSSVSEKFLWLYMLNPLTFPIEQIRGLFLYATMPDWLGAFYYSLVSIAVAYAGFALFQKTRKGFADVL